MTPTPLPTLADSLSSTFPCCDDAPLALATLDELAKGEPVAPAALAARADRDQAQVSQLVARWPNVHLNDQGRIVAFGGLSLTPTQHRFEVAGRELYTWCAWDTLFLPAVLEQTARVTSTCPITGAEVRLLVALDGIQDAEPASLRVSFPPPEWTDTSDITATFCCHVHFLAGQQAADQWLDGNAGALTLRLDEAFELGRLATLPLLRDGRPQASEPIAGDAA
jgi:alkylmercury lyase